MLSVSWIFTRIVATHAVILTSQRSTRTHVASFSALGTLPYRCPKTASSFGTSLQPRYIYGAEELDQ